jgi:hypothetical protein
MSESVVEKTVFWHRDLPPPTADVLGEHLIEAVSTRVSGTLAHRDELWQRCYEDLMSQATRRLQQELARLHGRYAHVISESVDSRHDDVCGEAWLHGRFTYMLYSGKNAGGQSTGRGHG